MQTETQVSILNAGLPVEQIQAAVKNQDVISSDVLVPRLLLKQPISEDVVSGQFRAGQLIRSTTGEIVMDTFAPGQPQPQVDIIPIRMDNSWANYEVVLGKDEYRNQEPRNASNEMLEWEYMKNGTQWKRKKVVTLYGILPADIQNFISEVKASNESGGVMDLSKTLMPVAISFQSTSFTPGAKPVATFFNNLKANSRLVKNISPINYTIPIFVTLEKGNKGSYFVLNVGKTSAYKAPEGDDGEFAKETLQSWYSLMSKMADINVDSAPVETTGMSESTMV